VLFKGGTLRTALAPAPWVIETTGSSAPTARLRTAPAPRTARPPRTRAFRAWIHPLAGLGILAVLLWRVGTGPFVDGLRLIDGWALVAALAVGVLTTVCSAWRWSLVAGGLGMRLPLRTAVADCYRSVFLNATLPGGVLGDVHRAVSHGRDAGDVSRGIRAVVWERTAGQFVQLIMALTVLLVFPSPVRPYMPAVIAIAAVGVLGALLVSRVLPRAGLPRWARGLGTAKADIRDGLLARGNWARITVASAVAVSGHLATFLIAARAAGSTAPLSRLIPLTLLALLAMGVPANVGGFGPREGVAAWAFGAAGLTAGQGVATAVVYGALVFFASLPGAAVLLTRRLRAAATVSPEGAVVG
jgi:glycosyltransferase 2 family protein